MNLNYRYDPIYWQTANLIVDSGAADEQSNDSTKYDKMAVAIATIQAEGVEVSLPLINTADFGFKPDAKNHKVIFGLKGINGINTETCLSIMSNRSYSSIEDFCNIHLIKDGIIKNNHMLKLIKAGCFTELHSKDRKETMDWYLRNYKFKPTTKLTFAQFGKMQELDIIPDSLKLMVRIMKFKDYVLADEGFVENVVIKDRKVPKCGYHDRHYILDENSQGFFEEHFGENSVVRVENGFFVVSEKKFKKEVDTLIQPLRDWFATDEALNAYNEAIYKSIWKDNASGTVESWSMEALSYYDGKHELEGLQEEKYGVVNYFDLPKDPVPYDYYTQWINGEPKKMPKYKISRLAGTIIATDNNHYKISLLTVYGLVNVKLPKGTFSFYKRQISVKMDENSDKKTVLEKSWLTRGNKIIVCGIRRDDQFWVKNYKDTVYKHTVNLIKEIYDDGTVDLQLERVKV